MIPHGTVIYLIDLFEIIQTKEQDPQSFHRHLVPDLFFKHAEELYVIEKLRYRIYLVLTSQLGHDPCKYRRFPEFIPHHLPPAPHPQIFSLPVLGAEFHRMIVHHIFANLHVGLVKPFPVIRMNDLLPYGQRIVQYLTGHIKQPYLCRAVPEHSCLHIAYVYEIIRTFCQGIIQQGGIIFTPACSTV